MATIPTNDNQINRSNSAGNISGTAINTNDKTMLRSKSAGTVSTAAQRYNPVGKNNFCPLIVCKNENGEEATFERATCPLNYKTFVRTDCDDTHPETKCDTVKMIVNGKEQTVQTTVQQKCKTENDNFTDKCDINTVPTYSCVAPNYLTKGGKKHRKKSRKTGKKQKNCRKNRKQSRKHRR